MALNKVIKIEFVGDPPTKERRSIAYIDDTTRIPEKSEHFALTAAQSAEWDRVMAYLEADTTGLSRVVDPISLIGYLKANF